VVVVVVKVMVVAVAVAVVEATPSHMGRIGHEFERRRIKRRGKTVRGEKSL
jgi:hypothetical protein